MLATTSSSSSLDCGGIQTLRQHDAFKVLSQVNVFQRPWRPSATSTLKQQRQREQQEHQRQQEQQRVEQQEQRQQQQLRQHQQQPRKVNNSRSQTTVPISCPELPNFTSSSTSSTMVCNTAPSAKRPSYFGAGTTSCSRAPAPAPPTAATGGATPPEDGSMCDTEALLLEPLLISPRSDRQNTAVGAHATAASTVYEDEHHDERIMSHSIGNSISSDSSNSSSSSSSGSSNGSSNSSINGYHLGGITTTSLSCQEMLSGPSQSIHVPSGRSLVPASPALSGMQGGGEPSFIPDQPLRGGAGRRAGGGNGAHHTTSNEGGWYLNFPSGAQQQRQQHQQQHPYQHRDHFHASSSQPPSTALALAAAAAGEPISAATSMAISAEINQAANGVPTSFCNSAVSSHHPAMPNGQRSAVGENGLPYSAVPSASGNRCGTYDAYPVDSMQQRTSWPIPTGQQQQQQQQHGSKSGINSSDSVNTYRHPRFVTREECVPGSRFPRSNASHASAMQLHQQQQLLQQQRLNQQHAFGGMDVPLNNSMNIITTVSGWQKDPSYGTTAELQSSSSGSNKRLHSQLSAGGGNGNGNGTTPCSSRFAEGAPSSSPPSSSSSSSTSSSSSSSTAPGSGGVAQMAARLTPMMLNARGHHGPGSKRMKVLEAADGSQGWANVPRGSSNGSHNGRRVSDGSAVEPVMTVMVSGSTNSNFRQRSGRGVAEATPSPPPSTTAAVKTAAAAVADEGEDDDMNGAGGAGSSGGESSLDWTERDESSEEEVASPAPSGGGGKGGGGGGKTKTPFMLDPKLWFVVERRAICNARQCAYRSEDDRRARRRHYHALCSHVHQNGERKGMRFQHHQLEKVQKHQRAHQVSAKQNNQRSSVTKPRSPSSSPIPRGKRTSTTNGQREQTRAIKDANVEAHSPKDWTPELTKRLGELVDELGPKWSSIAEQIPGKTATACMLHWRVGLNPNHLVKGSGTWTAEEDERLSKLVEVVGMKWSDLARHIPGRIAKQCRERYLNHLDPSLRKDMPWTEDEEALLMRLCFAKQNQWAEICRQLHGRSYNDVKNRFNLIQRRNKRAQGSPTTPPAGSTNPKAPLVAAADVKPIRRGRGSATPTASTAAAAGSNGRAGGVRAPYNGSSTKTGGVDGASTAVATPTTTSPTGDATAPIAGTGADSSSSSSSSSSSFASGGAMAAGGWGPAAAAATAADAAAAKAVSADGTTSTGTSNESDASSSSPPLCLVGDDLGEFGIGGQESASPGSGFAPGGYWHQMVKGEAQVTSDENDETVVGAGTRSSTPPSTAAEGRAPVNASVV